jgi:O-acetyl-ADP-ribose deacetylase (regulator of RNase III)
MLIPNVTDCVRNALKKADDLTDVEINSILFPLIGTGTSIRMSAQEMADQLIDVAVSYLEDNPESRIKKIYFLAFNEQDRDICHHTFVTDPRIATPGETIPSP